MLTMAKMAIAIQKMAFAMANAIKSMATSKPVNQ
jgi:hypothetical protein